MPVENIPMAEMEPNARAALGMARVDPNQFTRLENAASAMAIDIFRFRICQTPDEIGHVVKEQMNFQEFANIFTPFYAITLEDQRNKTTKMVRVDGVSGRLF
jgi:hypothetical protein